MFKIAVGLCAGVVVLGGCASVRDDAHAASRLQGPRPDDVTLRVIDWRVNRELKFYTFKYNPNEPARPCHYLGEALAPMAKVVWFEDAGHCGLGEGRITEVRLRHDWDK